MTSALPLSSVRLSNIRIPLLKTTFQMEIHANNDLIFKFCLFFQVFHYDYSLLIHLFYRYCCFKHSNWRCHKLGHPLNI